LIAAGAQAPLLPFSEKGRGKKGGGKERTRAASFLSLVLLLSSGPVSGTR